MPAATPSKGSKGLLSVRSRELVITPPGIMGFENLITPDEFVDNTGKRILSFKVQVHHNPAQVERLAEVLEKDVAVPAFKLFLAEAEKTGAAEPKGGWQMPDAAAWLDDHLKDPSERSKTQLPSIGWKNGAEYKDRKSGDMKRKTMQAYDGENHLLDLKALKLGMGSTIQAVLMGGLYKSPLIKQPDFSLKLQGVRVLQLIQYGGGSSHLTEVDDEDLAGLEDGFEVQSLGSFARASDDEPLPAHVAEDLEDGPSLEDELPF